MKLPKVLGALLRLKRPHGGLGEKIASTVVQARIRELGHTPDVDSFGNISVTVGPATSGVYFTSHLDTVHREDGQIEPVLIADEMHLVADDCVTKQPSVLGADDAAGVFLMTEMIAAGKPGHYIFFLGEECGGLGSSDYIMRNQNLSASICVSFDRRGTGDVITHQGGYRTASDEFARALSSALNQANPGFQYSPSSGGLYTDSKEFAELVPECTNISVGYENEHTPRECLDLEHLLALRDAVLATDWEALPIHRVPTPDDWLNNWNKQAGGGGWDDTPYISFQERIQTAISKHYAVLPLDVLNLLEELEELWNE